MSRATRSAPVVAEASNFRKVQAASVCTSSSAIASAAAGALSCSCMVSDVSALKIAGIQPEPSASRSASLAMLPFFNFASRVDVRRGVLLHGFQNRGLRHMLEIAVSGGLPPCGHVQADSLRQFRARLLRRGAGLHHVHRGCHAYGQQAHQFILRLRQ